MNAEIDRNGGVVTICDDIRYPARQPRSEPRMPPKFKVIIDSEIKIRSTIPVENPSDR